MGYRVEVTIAPRPFLSSVLYYFFFLRFIFNDVCVDVCVFVCGYVHVSKGLAGAIDIRSS